MGVTILVCPCGLKLKAAGMVPGKSGRCPRCSRLLRLPEGESPRRAGPGVEDEWDWEGTYDLEAPPAPPDEPMRALYERWPDELDGLQAPDGPEAPGPEESAPA